MSEKETYIDSHMLISLSQNMAGDICEASQHQSFGIHVSTTHGVRTCSFVLSFYLYFVCRRTKDI